MSAKKSKAGGTLAERRERVLDEITLERIKMREAVTELLVPVHRFEALRERAGGARHWLYPVAPVIALLAFRMRPRLCSLPSLLTRGWTVWRLWQRFH
ncbi:hypothetical protein OVY01_10320 [Robbsia sp. Bb-Pol-6]|uniref:Uncharacterized protein n=1 Tax=Robbsia betulipollinis TaxID=2981849 RepID=A0ABT3ZNW0_9BURK|nr:hypothetical protein [Robbsia betulipollinis]MCY0387620.1 hypothetical protein [Robbsia betulipollinis]